MSDRDVWLSQDDATLIAACRVDTHLSSGPGGQHANKTRSAVRLRHRQSGVTVVAEEERSQHANKRRAVKRLRLAIALGVRVPVGPSWSPPEVFEQHVTLARRIDVSRRHADYAGVVAVALDALAAYHGHVREAGETLGLSTGQFSRFIVRDGKVLDAANRIRQRAGLRALR
jgi:hypothetical protein